MTRITKKTAVCPKCGQIDRIQKVTSVVSEGTTRVRMEGTVSVRSEEGTRDIPTRQEGSSVTELAKRLQKPTFPFGLIFKKFMYGSLISFIAIVGLGMVAGGLVDFNFSRSEWIIRVVIILIGAICLISAIVFTASFITSLSSGKIKEEGDEIQERYERAVRRWNQLYYCYRDDIVFIPGEDDAIVLEDMYSYLDDSGKINVERTPESLAEQREELEKIREEEYYRERLSSERRSDE